MNNLFHVVKAAHIVIAVAAMGVLGTAAAKDITLRFSTFQPQNQWYVQRVLLPFFADVAKVTDGRVKIDLLPKVVGSPQAQFDVVRDGLADMAYIVPSYTPGRFPLVEMGELPGAGADPVANAEALVRIYRKHFEGFNEFAGVKVVTISLTSPVQIFNSKRSITSLKDFEGLKLRTTGEVQTEALKLLGGVPVLKSSAEAFAMLQTGVIDGQMTPPGVLISSNTLPYTKFATLIPGGAASVVTILGVNAAKWAQISEKDRQAIEAISFEPLAKAVGMIYKQEDQRAADAMKAAGYEIYHVDAKSQFAQEIKNVLQPIEDQWVQRAKKLGVPNPMVTLNEYRAATGSR